MKQSHIYYLSGIAAVIIVILLSRNSAQQEAPPPHPASLPSNGLTGPTTAEVSTQPATATHAGANLPPREPVEPARIMPELPAVSIEKTSQKEGLPPPPLLSPAR